MKKLYTLALSLIFCTGAFSQIDQTFVFTDASGNIIPDGTILTVNNYEEDEFDETLKFPSGVFVKNVTDANAYAGMKLNITKLDNGKVQHCFPGNCQMYTSAGEVVRTDAKALKSGDSMSLQSEWIPTAKGTCSVTYTLRLMRQTKPMPPTYEEQAVGATITVNYVYDDNSQNIALGIKDVHATTANDGKAFNLSGQVVDQNYKGVVVKNGRKYLSK